MLEILKGLFLNVSLETRITSALKLRYRHFFYGGRQKNYGVLIFFYGVIH